MRVWMGVALVLALAGPASAADQFNLTCTKMERGTVVAEKRVYRIDLKGKRWCTDDCSSVDPIKSFTADKITLNESGAVDKPVRFLHVINRGTGEYTELYDNPSLGMQILIEGRCIPAPFVEIPRSMF